MNLLISIIIPLLTGIAILLVQEKQSRVVALAGSVLQLGLILYLYISFTHEREVGNVVSDAFRTAVHMVSLVGIQFSYWC
jgi:NADH:ubiquinone oxidoreductase subunit 4 (subunit M)